MIGHTFGRMSRGGSDDEMFGKLYDINVIKRISPYIWRYKKYSAIGAICTLLSASLAVLIPYFIKIGIDDYINNPNIGIASQKSGLIKISLIFGLTMFNSRIIFNCCYDTSRYSYLSGNLHDTFNNEF